MCGREVALWGVIIAVAVANVALGYIPVGELDFLDFLAIVYESITLAVMVGAGAMLGAYYGSRLSR